MTVVLADVTLLARIVRNQEKLLAFYRVGTARAPGKFLDQLTTDKEEALRRGLIL